MSTDYRNHKIREIDGKFWVYIWDQQRGQCRLGNWFANSAADSAVKYVGKPFETLQQAKRWIYRQTKGLVIESTYQIAFVREDGGWDIVKTFRAADDDAANAYAEAHYADKEWYVLLDGQNING